MLRAWQDFMAVGGYLLLIPAALHFESPLIRAACLVAVFLLALAAWLINLRRLRAIRDTPTSRVASAAQGYVELIGTGRAMPDQIVYSPAHRLPCLWYRYRRFERRGDKWQQTDSGESSTTFILDDGSGRCLLDPIGADILTDRKESYQEADFKIDEELLLIDSPLYALGEFSTRRVVFDERVELGHLLEEWKQDQTSLNRRFDLDGNGEIDQQEWQLARAAAQREIDQRKQAALDAPVSHVLSRPRSGRPFIIANSPPEHLTNRYRLKVWFHFAICLASLPLIPLIT
jgi:hypothetical protein